MIKKIGRILVSSHHRRHHHHHQHHSLWHDLGNKGLTLRYTQESHGRLMGSPGSIPRNPLLASVTLYQPYATTDVYPPDSSVAFPGYSTFFTAGRKQATLFHLYTFHSPLHTPRNSIITHYLFVKHKNARFLGKEEIPDKMNAGQMKIFPATHMGRTPSHCYILVQETPKQFL